MAPDGAPRDARQRGVGLSGDRTRAVASGSNSFSGLLGSLDLLLVRRRRVAQIPLGVEGAAGAGAAAVNVPIPNNPALVNFHLFTQSAVLDLTNLGNTVTTNGIDGKVGDL